MNVTVIGLPGCGKSSLLHRLARRGKLVALEPLNIWEDLLYKALINPQKFSFVFQIKATLDLIERDGSNGCGVIRERDAISSANIFTQVAIKNEYIIPEGLEIVQQLCNLQHKNQTSLYVYLRVQPSLALERIIGRDRPGEKKRYSVEYLEQLLNAHEQFIGGEGNVTDSGVPVIHIDGSQPKDLVYDTFCAAYSKCIASQSANTPR